MKKYNYLIKKYILSILTIIPALVCAQDIQTHEFRVILDQDTDCQYIVSGDTILNRVDTNGELLCGRNSSNKLKLASLKPIFIIDTGTGCEYVRTFESKGMTYRLDQRGHKICRKDNVSNYSPLPM